MLMDKILKSCTKAAVLFQFFVLFEFCTITSSSISSSNSQHINLGQDKKNGFNQYQNITKYKHHEPRKHFTHQWAVHIPGGNEVADQLASKHGFENTGEIFPDYYHFVHRKVAKRSVEPCHEYHQALSAEPEVRWHAQQVVKRRSKRDFLQLGNWPSPSTSLSTNNGGSGFSNRNRNLKPSIRSANMVIFNDPRWPAMWYLNRGGGLDMNVQEAWAEGITGKGIVVTILDDGLEKDHPDIIQNYDPLASFDVNSLDNDPMPSYDLTDSNRHGTRCAGEVAAEANNSLCAVGIAYEASVGGVRMLDGDVTDAVEARSLSHNPQHIDIYSASWGPDDDGKTVDGPGELATRAFLEGITKGRQGKGSIFVWASGNGGRDHDNCNCDGYTNSIWTLSISSATENGLVPWYSEACSSTLATTYSSGGTGEKQIVTIDLHHSCTSSHTGTSASAPLAAGICALALQANRNLTWRDMQHIVVRTARPSNLIAPDWATNGVGRNVSHSFGYGLMDAGAMVKLARNWKTVPEQNKCEVRAPYTDKNIPAKSKVTLDLKVTECAGVNLLEHVQAKVTLTSGRRGDLQIYLVSPRGTRSVLLAHRRHDLNRSGFTDWPFMSVHNWGESPLGKWTLEIHNEGRYVGRTVLKKWSLILHGTKEDVNEFTPSFSSSKSENSKLALSNSTIASDQFNSSNKTLIIAEDAYFQENKNNTRSNIALESGVPTVKKLPNNNKQKPKGKTVQKKTQKGVANSEVLGISNNRFTTCNPDESSCSPSPNVSTTSLPRIIENETTASSDSSPKVELEILPTDISVSNNLSVTPPAIHPNTDLPVELSSIQTSSASPNTSTSTPEQTNNTTGKLQSWAFVGHGITTNPNDPTTPSSETEKSVSFVKEPQISGGGMEFDGSENKIVLEPSQVQRNEPISISSAPDTADISSPPASASSSAASSLQFYGCLKMSSPGKCIECKGGFYLQDFLCVSSCSYNHFIGVDQFSGAKICLPCHYTCRTCYGSNVSNCLTCFSDSEIRTTTRTVFSPDTDSSDKNKMIQTTFKESHCYPTALLNTIDGNELWYKALLMGVIINVTIVIFLVFYIWIQRQREGNIHINNNNNFTANGGESVDGDSTISSSWLGLNKNIYSRVSPNDQDDDDEDNINIMIAQNQKNESAFNGKELNIGSKLDPEYKIAIPTLKTSKNSKSYNNNLMSSSGHAKSLNSNEQRSVMPIPLHNLSTSSTDPKLPSSQTLKEVSNVI